MAENYDLKIFDSLYQVLEESEDPEGEWLWCIFCERFFQARYLRIDYLGNRQGCAYCECAGFDCALFRWDTFLEDGPGSWPDSVSQLHNGMKLPVPSEVH